jgi:hypothetical protein
MSQRIRPDTAGGAGGRRPPRRVLLHETARAGHGPRSFVVTAR